MKKKCISLILILTLILTISCNSFAWYTGTTTTESIDVDTQEAWSYLTEQRGGCTENYTIPGLMETASLTEDNYCESCTNMTPQGICYALYGRYMLISAYCSNAEHDSVIYVLDGNTKQLCKTLVLNNTFYYEETTTDLNWWDSWWGKSATTVERKTVHVGGIACSPDCIWVCDSDSNGYSLLAYDISVLGSGNSVEYIDYSNKVSVDIKPSFLCYNNGLLYTGLCTDEMTTTIMRYTADGYNAYYNSEFTVDGIKEIQGINVRDNDIILTSSWNRNSNSEAYVFHNIQTPATISYLTSDEGKCYNLPNMLEGCYIGTEEVWFLFESGASAYRYPRSDHNDSGIRPFDQFIGINRSNFEF